MVPLTKAFEMLDVVFVDKGAAGVPNAPNEVVAVLVAAGGCPNAGAGAGAGVVLPKPRNDVEEN